MERKYSSMYNKGVVANKLAPKIKPINSIE